MGLLPCSLTGWLAVCFMGPVKTEGGFTWRLGPEGDRVKQRAGQWKRKNFPHVDQLPDLKSHQREVERFDFDQIILYSFSCRVPQRWKCSDWLQFSLIYCGPINQLNDQLIQSKWWLDYSARDISHCAGWRCSREGQGDERTRESDCMKKCCISFRCVSALCF